MEQPQFKVSFSLGTKLLLSVVGLLFIVIGFLNLSTILILREDKRAYTFQSQSVEAMLAGKEIVNLSKHGLDTLRVFLGTIDPLKPITPQQTAGLQSSLNNQSEIVAASIGLLDVKSGKSTFLTQVSRTAEALKAADLSPDDLKVAPDVLKDSVGDLTTRAFTILNISKLGKTPLIAVAYAEKKLQSNPSGMPIALGIIPLKTFANELRGSSEITIVTRDGGILFDSDPSQIFAGNNVGSDPFFAKVRSAQLESGAQEYVKDGSHYLGSYVRPGLDMLVLSKTDWRKAMQATYTLTEKFILLGLMAIGVAVIFAIFFSKTLIRPILRLYEATKEVARGNFNVHLRAKGRDEIAALTGSFNVMSKQIVELISEKVEKARIDNELAIASTVQQTLIPPNHFKNEMLTIRSHYQSASECGGDWWGFFGVNNKVCLMIGDATGHGLPAALITAAARSCFSVMHKLAQEAPDFSFSPGSMLSYANRVIHDSASGKIMMTFFMGVLDFDEMTFTYASAGHNPPWMFQKTESGFKMKSLIGRGARLGEARDVPEYEEEKVSIQPGDLLFLYTDGLIEGKNLNGDMFGKKRARKTVEAALKKGPEGIINDIVADFVSHNGEKPLDDDLTLACTLITHPGGAAAPNAQA